jgi:hypothetical protein
MEESEPNPDRQLTVVPAAKPPRLSRAIAASIVVPAIVTDAGDAAAKRFLEFFAVTIRNKNTRTAYLHAAGRFFAWCEHHQLGALDEIEPLHVAAYIEALGKDFEKPTVKQHLAAIRMLFDWLVTGQVVARGLGGVTLKIKWRNFFKIIWRCERYAGTGRRSRAAGPPGGQNGISRRYPRQSRRPLKRVGYPDDIAGLVAYLASGESGYMTGSSVTIDGGMAL